MTDVIYEKSEIWFLTGSQHLYGPETLQRVESQARAIVGSWQQNRNLPVQVLFQSPLTTSCDVFRIIQLANASEACVGVICWMHTFSPGKMWIRGLKSLQKPLLHLHTQYVQEIPWSTIDMKYMNLNQSAHGGREFGHIMSRLDLSRKVLVGHWQDAEVLHQVSSWARVAVAWADLQTLHIARLGDNMRQVAVTEGDKVDAQLQLGVQVNGYGLGDLVEHIDGVEESEIRALIEAYESQYDLVDELKVNGSARASLEEAARIEAGLRSFLDHGSFGAFTDTFENLTGLHQLPGIAVQRLMADGFGFGAEGDWMTAGLVRAVKVMTWGLAGGSSFMEDYTYHFDAADSLVLGAHMLEICPTIATGRPRCEIHELKIGNKANPVRLVFSAGVGPALNASLVDLGHRFRLLVNAVESLPQPMMPKLPVARVLWKPEPNLATAAAAWILAGGSHHTCFSQGISWDHLQDFAEIANIELVRIDAQTEIYAFKQKLRWNQAYYDRR